MNGELEKVYTTQPKGFFINGEEDKVYKLNKALYKLKQAPQAWGNKIKSYFHQNGFVVSDNEPIIYLKKQDKHDPLVVCLYVDDIIYMAYSHSFIAEFKDYMAKMFEMSDLGLFDSWSRNRARSG